MRVKDERAMATRKGEDAYKARAAYYGLYLRTVEGLGVSEAAARVIERYPLVRPFLERLTRHAADPLQAASRP